MAASNKITNYKTPQIMFCEKRKKKQIYIKPFSNNASFLYSLKGYRTIAPEESCSPNNCPTDNCPLDNYPSDNCSPDNLPPSKIVHEENCLPENCPLTIKFPSKIIAPTQVNSPQKRTTSVLRKAKHCLRVL